MTWFKYTGYIHTKKGERETAMESEMDDADPIDGDLSITDSDLAMEMDDADLIDGDLSITDSDSATDEPPDDNCRLFFKNTCKLYLLILCSSDWQS